MDAAELVNGVLEVVGVLDVNGVLELVVDNL